MKEEHTIFKVSRRDFITKTGILGAGGFFLGIKISFADKKQFITGNPAAVFTPNVYINITGSGLVTLIAHRSEMGTGIRTSLPLVMADELEADWKQVKIEQAVGDEKYGDQNTDGSYSMRMFYPQMRKAGATVRMMLEQAAANEWKVPVSECKAKNHQIIHKSGKTLGYGYLAEKASKVELPKETEIILKDGKNFKFIGKKTSTYDQKDIVTGKAKFGLDTNLPNMKFALIKRNPEPGPGVVNYNDTATKAIEGVIKVFKLVNAPFPMGFQKPIGGVVVVAENTWAAIKGRKVLDVEFEKGTNADYDTEAYQAKMLADVNKPGNAKRAAGDVNSALKAATKTIKTDYVTSHLSHTSMETPCAVANVKADGTCEVWAPVQDPQTTRKALAKALEVDIAKVNVNVTLLGGGFGRKSKPDFVLEAALISKEIQAPVKLLWTREDDIQHDYYHSNSAQHIEVALNAENKVTGWLHRSAFPSIGGTATALSKAASGGELSMTMIDNPIDSPNISMEVIEATSKTRIGWLRSVANIHHAFAVGSTFDQIAYTRGVDPAQNLIDILGSDRTIEFGKLSKSFSNYNEKEEDFPWQTGRLRKVIETVKEKSGWGKKMPKGSGMGIAAHRSFLTYVACVVEIVVDAEVNIKIPMVHYAVDCGLAVNPDRVKSQFEGGAAFAASLALKSAITMKNGHVEQSNFHNYQVARIVDAPYATKVHLIESTEKPTGVGEPPVPPFIPALCNAIFAAVGKRITKLPIDLNQL
jgi:isoquinoline 1-oxidoreductase subunit beta